MANQMDREGNFRGTIEEYGLSKFDSGAVAVSIRVRVEEAWNGQEWEDWRDYAMEADGLIFVTKKDGNMNEKAIESLMLHAGWNGSFQAINEGSWKPRPIGFTTKVNIYKEQTRYQVAFVNAYDRVPAAGQMASEDVANLDARFGSQLRAFNANLKRNTVPATNASKPSAPPPRQTSTPAAKAGVPADDAIPF